jgi:hypothetical protein
MLKQKTNKRSQVTIFIILALIIVVSIALIFVLLNNKQKIISPQENPQEFISNCVKNKLSDFEKIILEGNGYLNITDNYILYSGNKPQEKVPYLCKTSLFYAPCINQEPMFIEFVRKEFENQAKKDTAACFNDLNQVLKKSGYQVSEGNQDIEISFQTKSILETINKKLTIKRAEETKTIELFKAEVQSTLPELINTARIIVNYESAFCEFNSVSWMNTHRDISIKKFVAGDGSKIYTLADKISGKKLNFAVKTCIMPAGI